MYLLNEGLILISDAGNHKQQTQRISLSFSSVYFSLLVLQVSNDQNATEPVHAVYAYAYGETILKPKRTLTIERFSVMFK